MTVSWDAVQGIWSVIGGLIGLGGVAVAWITSVVRAESKEREASAALIIAGQTVIKDNLGTIHADMEKRVDRLEQQARDFRPGASIDALVDHSKKNVMQAVEGLKLNTDRALLGLDALRDRVTRVETQHEQTTKSVAELKTELKETRHEIGERLKEMSMTQQSQFEQLCSSIRELRDVKAR